MVSFGWEAQIRLGTSDWSKTEKVRKKFIMKNFIKSLVIRFTMSIAVRAISGQNFTGILSLIVRFTAIGVGRSLVLILSVSAMYRCILSTVQHSDCHLALGITEIRCETSEKSSGHGAALFRDAHRPQSHSLADAVGSGRCKACFGPSKRLH